jgi:hypothetical protein
MSIKASIGSSGAVLINLDLLFDAGQLSLSDKRWR